MKYSKVTDEGKEVLGTIAYSDMPKQYIHTQNNAISIWTINSTSLRGLVANTRYCFRLFEVNEFGGVKMLNYRVDSNTSRSRNTPL